MWRLIYSTVMQDHLLHKVASAQHTWSGHFIKIAVFFSSPLGGGKLFNSASKASHLLEKYLLEGVGYAGDHWGEDHSVKDHCEYTTDTQVTYLSSTYWRGWGMLVITWEKIIQWRIIGNTQQTLNYRFMNCNHMFLSWSFSITKEHLKEWWK